MSNYQHILNDISTIIATKNCHIHWDLIDEAYIFEIKKTNVVISYIQLYSSNGNITPKYKHDYIETEVFNITYLFTELIYRNQGFALLLLIYGICYIKMLFPYVNYAILDDNSDKHNQMINIYNIIGFTFRDIIKLDMEHNNKIMPSGPEKQLAINHNFILRVYHILNKKFY
jgi:hypothetical protein